METVLLNELELQVEHLIQELENLNSENKMLRQRLATAVSDRSILQERHHVAAKQIKTIMGQLKEEINE